MASVAPICSVLASPSSLPPPSFCLFFSISPFLFACAWHPSFFAFILSINLLALSLALALGLAQRLPCAARVPASPALGVRTGVSVGRGLGVGWLAPAVLPARPNPGICCGRGVPNSTWRGALCSALLPVANVGPQATGLVIRWRARCKADRSSSESRMSSYSPEQGSINNDLGFAPPPVMGEEC